MTSIPEQTPEPEEPFGAGLQALVSDCSFAEYEPEVIDEEVPLSELGEDFEERYALIADELFACLEQEVEAHPKFLEVMDFLEHGLSQGWTPELERRWQAEEQQALDTRSQVESMYLSLEEWTFETAVADRLLCEGVVLYAESLARLRRAIQVSRQEIQEALGWFVEGLLRLLAVPVWEANCVLSPQ